MKKILFLSLILIFTQNNLSFANCLKGDCNNGFGTWEDVDFKYIGQFKDGFFNGQGTVIFNDGESYTGEFSNDVFNGYGTYIFLKYSNKWLKYIRNMKFYYNYVKSFIDLIKHIQQK